MYTKKKIKIMYRTHTNVIYRQNNHLHLFIIHIVSLKLKCLSFSLSLFFYLKN